MKVTHFLNRLPKVAQLRHRLLEFPNIAANFFDTFVQLLQLLFVPVDLPVQIFKGVFALLLFGLQFRKVGFYFKQFVHENRFFREDLGGF